MKIVQSIILYFIVAIAITITVTLQQQQANVSSPSIEERVTEPISHTITIQILKKNEKIEFYKPFVFEAKKLQTQIEEIKVIENTLDAVGFDNSIEARNRLKIEILEDYYKKDKRIPSSRELKMYVALLVIFKEHLNKN